MLTSVPLTKIMKTILLLFILIILTNENGIQNIY